MALAPYLPEAERTKALQAALATVHRSLLKEFEMVGLVSLARYLPEHLMADALSDIRAWEDEKFQLVAMASLASYLPKSLMIMLENF